MNKMREEERNSNWQAFEEKVRMLNVSLDEKEKSKKAIIHQ